MSLFADNFKLAPYWWDHTPRPQPSESPLPKSVEVLIIGSGYTGLCAAIQTARGGRQTLVVDAKAAGWGCSSRNGGQVSSSIKPDFAALRKKWGDDQAMRILREGHNALDWIEQFVATEGIDCDYARVGRFCGAHSEKQFAALKTRLDLTPDEFVRDSYLVDRSAQRDELGSDAYYGGMISTRHASLNPAKYHQGLLQLAIEAGVEVVDYCKVEKIHRANGGFRVMTSKGEVAADKVVVATSGYTGNATPWHQRRIIPIGSYIIATEPIDGGLMKVLMPKNRVIVDTKKLVVYYRTSPDGQRILFGGRVSIGEIEARRSVPKMHRLMCEIFPQLQNVKVSHCWMGFVGYTFDGLPHIGEDEGLFYSMGYCGSGISLSSYLGSKVGQQVIGHRDGETALSEPNFQTRPLYSGKPWFLAPSVGYYRIRDRFS